jgi:hypothetical protein
MPDRLAAPATGRRTMGLAHPPSMGLRTQPKEVL